jgi:hypothetical protein
VDQGSLNDIKMLSMPDCLQSGSKHRLHFHIRIREKQTAFKNHCLNCFVSFTQARDATTRRGFFQRSIVLVCKHPFSSLAYNVLRRLCVVVDGLPQKSIAGAERTAATVTKEQYDNNINVVIEVCFEHFLSWPHPNGGEHMQLPFYGDIINFTVPSLMTYVDSGIETEKENRSELENKLSPNRESHSPSRPDIPSELASGVASGSKTSRLDDGLGGGGGLFGDDNIVALMRPLGLLPHLWTLWELVVTGKDILVWAPSPELCSRVVAALVSLSAPLAYGGDFRPYITPYDSDVSLLVAASTKNHELLEYQSLASSGSSMLGAVSMMGCSTEVSTPPSSFGSDGSIFEAMESLYDLTTGGGSAFAPQGRPGTLDTTAPSDGIDDLHEVTVEYVSFSTSSSPEAHGIARGLLPDPTTQSPPSHQMGSSNSSSTPPENIARAVSGSVSSGKCRAGSSFGSCVTSTSYSNGEKPPSLIVGITNPYLLKTFSHFDSCILLPIYEMPQPQDGSIPSPPPSQPNGKSPDNCVSPFSAARSQRHSLYASRPSSKEVPPPPEAIFLDIGSRGFGKMPMIGQNKVTDDPPRTPPPSLPPRPPAPTRPEPEFPCSINRIGMSTSLEAVYDKWITSGGAGTMSAGAKNTMICLRHPVSVKPDTRILHMLNSASFDDVLGSQQQPLSALFSMRSSGSGAVASAESDLSERSRRDIQGNMLIREHFRQLTCWLMKPFEGHFQARSDLERSLPAAATSPWSNRSSPSPSPAGTPSYFKEEEASSASTSTATIAAVTATSSTYTIMSSQDGAPVTGQLKSHLSLQIAAQQQSPHRRRGASSLWLYRNPNELLGTESMGASIRRYRKSGRHIPECFLQARRQELYTAFAESHTFLNYYRWRKKNLTAQMMMEMALACCSLSGQELIEQFAIEKGSDVITQLQMKELEARINMYIRALSTVQSKPAHTSWLISKMQEHLQAISQLW